MAVFIPSLHPSHPVYPTSQFVLLLALFVKPMRVPQGSTKSGGAVYRRVVIRNIVCTAGIVLSYTISTCIMILKWLSDGTDMEEV